MTWLKALFRFYALAVISTIIFIAIASQIAPLWIYVEAIPNKIAVPALQLAWLSMVAIVVGWLIDDWWPEAADQGKPQVRSFRQRLQDLAPWLQGSSASECADEPPVLSPPLKSLPAPEHD